MASVEEKAGIHSSERSQVDRTKTKPEQFAEHCKLDSTYCDSNTYEEIKSKVKVIEG